MKVGWLIDGGMFEHYRDELLHHIEAQGHEAKLVQSPAPPFRWEDIARSYHEMFPPNQCVVAHGDIELATRIYQEKIWKPGAFCEIDKYKCSNYVCFLGPYWLNRDYTMLPFGEMKRRKEFLFDAFGQSGSIFVRPDSPLKLFTGQLANYDSFDADIEFMGFYEFPIESLVVVSSPKKVVDEWRFVVAQGQVVTGCKYASSGQQVAEAGYPQQAFQLAEKIVGLVPDPEAAFIVDVCRTSEGLFQLLEIGGFSFF